MKKITLLIALVFVFVQAQSQDYEISFQGIGSFSVIDNILVENVTKGTSVNVTSNDIVHLVAPIDINKIDNPVIIRIYPNPLKNSSKIEFNMVEKGDVIIELIDITGKIISSTNTFLEAGTHTFEIKDVKSGVYTLSISSESFKYTNKIISQSNSNGPVQINYISSSSVDKTDKLHEKEFESIITIAYNNGDVMRYTAYSNLLTSIITDIPNMSKVITFSSTETIPTLTTTIASLITETTASSGGNISSNGGATVIESGICWSTTSLPTTENNKIPSTTTIGSFTSPLIGLTANTTYYIRAYAINSQGTAYGNEISFTTSQITLSIPTITTTAISAISQTTAISGGNITSNGGALVTASGICWNTATLPTTSNSKATSSTTSGSFTGLLSTLTANTKYYVRAYATNSQGTAYGNEISFTTSPITTNTLCESIDNCNYTFTSNSTPQWTGQSTISKDGIDAGKSGTITHSQQSILETTVTGPLDISFWWQVSSEESYDKLTFYIDNVNQINISGEKTWEQLQYYVGQGSHTIKWVYSKDVSGSLGSDCGWVDNVVLTSLPISAPSLTTSEARSICATLGTVDGTITRDGGASITSRGICWSTSPNPTIADSKKISSSTTFFSASLTPLTINTKYYARAYATNSIGTGYGNEITFTTTDVSLPIVSISYVADILITAAVVNGRVISNGGLTLSEAGICWSTSPNPTTADRKTIENVNSSSYITHITGLTPNTRYYVRIYATNSMGTSYSDEIVFETLQEDIFNTSKTYHAVTDIEGNVYKTIVIGTQEWMAENLKVTKFNDGSDIPLETESGVWAGTTGWWNLTTPAYCWFNNDSTSYGNTYGALYNWYTINTADNGGKNICPTGWHVATDDEWTILEIQLQNNNYNYDSFIDTDNDRTTNNKTAISLASKTGWNENTSDGGVGNPDYLTKANLTGFSALPNGFRQPSGGFMSIQYASYWWTATAMDVTNARNRYIKEGGSEIGRDETFYTNKKNGYAIRCMRDYNASNTSIPTIETNTTTAISQTTATSGGTIKNNGGDAISVSGICWNTSPKPTIANSKTTNGTITGTFTSSLTSLNSNTIYYVRAYATNSVGTAYGNEICFKSADIQTVTLCESIDDCIRTFTTSGGSNWIGQTTISHDGIDAAKSGNIINNQESILQTTTTEQVYVSFSWKVSSEPEFDYAAFYIDNVLQDSISGEVNWEQKRFYVSKGTHTLKWVYHKDKITSRGNDCAWIDGIVIEAPTISTIPNIDFNGTTLYVYPEDNSNSASWWNGTFIHTYATSDNDGRANTTTIVSALGYGTYAASVCEDLNAYGYSDWYLPSKDELNEICANKQIIGGFSSNVIYWSSTEYNYGNAWGQYFNSCNQFGNCQKSYGHIRCVRKN